MSSQALDLSSPIVQNFLINLLLLIVIIMAVMVTAFMIADRKSDKKRKQCIEEKKQLLKELELTQQLLQETKEKYEEKIRQLTKLAKPLMSIGEALESGVIIIKHAKDGGRVIPLPDGTLVCDKGHVIYPQVEEDGQREPGLAPS